MPTRVSIRALGQKLKAAQTSYIFVEGVDMVALIQLPDEARIGKVFRLAAVPLSSASKIVFMPSREGYCSSTDRFTEQVFPSFHEHVAIDVTTDILLAL